MYSSRVPRRASRVWGTLLFCNLVLASIRASNLSILPRLSLDASRVPGLVFLFTLMLASKRVSKLSKLPSRVPRRASRVSGHSSFYGFLLASKRISKIINTSWSSVLTRRSRSRLSFLGVFVLPNGLCLRKRLHTFPFIAGRDSHDFSICLGKIRKIIIS